ncbi:MAG: T9SS type A sorting domain-containing protein [Saprospiraceae bacterium]|nr:T9SS type A sorting domain-containing protein [Saprospiraceae bacterium]MBK9726773.1 T9SS type A sorting domain-containing protein [Saprospiraceae bacterium]
MTYVNYIKLLITLASIIELHFLGLGQSEYFTSIIKGPRDGDYAWSVKSMAEGYAYCSGTYCYNEQKGCMVFGITNLEGISVWNNKFIRDPEIQCSAVSSFNNSIYLVGNSHFYRPDNLYHNLKPFILKLNASGDTLWKYFYGEVEDPNSPIQNIALYFKFSNEHIYMLEGVWNKDTIGFSSYIRVIKIDTNGVVLWKTRLNSTNPPKTFQPKSRYLQFDEQGNILVCVAVDTILSQAETIPYTAILNQNGQILNEGKLYPLERDPFNYTFYPIKGAFTRNHNAVWISEYNWNEGILIYAFDSTRKKIWRTIINSPWEAIYYPSIFGWSNGDMIGLYDTAERFKSTKPRGSGLLRISPSGQLKWKRRYYMSPWTDKSPIELNFGAVDETKDGGIIVSGGYTFYNQWREIDQDVLLVKLDSLGCPYNDCTESDTIIILKESVTATVNLKKKESYNWTINNDQVKLIIRFEQGIRKPELEIDLLNLNGQTILKQKLASYEYEITIPISGLNPGMYILQMKSGKIIKAFKFIV